MIYAFEDRRVELRGEQHFIAPNATVIGSVILEDRSSVWFNAVVRGDNDLIHIGEASNVQDGSVLHVDPGFKSVILNSARIGANCLIGANTLITEGKEIPDNSLVMGSPGKVVRELTNEELAGLTRAADSYVNKIIWYAKAFAPEPR